MKATLRLYVITFLSLVAWPGVSTSEDTDLFMATPPGATTNVLIILDNSANWSASLSDGTKFDAEVKALDTVLSELDGKFNVGLMLFGESGSGNTSPVTAYMRYAVRTMDATNREKLRSVITDLHINNDKGNNSPYGFGLYEAFKYFGGATAFGGFGQLKRDYPGNPNNPLAGSLPDNAFKDKTSDQYVSPLGDDCAKNYIIYLSNGMPQSGADSGTPNASELLAKAGGDITTIPLSNNTAQGNIGDEYARFLYEQNINTYTIFAHNPTKLSGNDKANVVLLQSMANQGRGKYFAASDTASLISALKTIFNEIQSVNEVFASVSLPVSVNVRGTSLNQVYMGVFRPDPNSQPRWLGNLKEYQLIKSGDQTFLGDVNGFRADNPTTGFISNTAVSFWTKDSTFWSFSPSGNPPSPSDKPDGPLVEKGGAAQQLRIDFKDSQAGRKLYTCTSSCPAGKLSDTPFNTTTINPSVTSNQTSFGAATAAELTDIINWVRGADNKEDENLNGILTDIRASIHGDVVHSRPAVVNYNRTGTCESPDEDDVMVYYGVNDGVFHALKGGKGINDGKEQWGFIPPELYAKLKRLRDNSPPNKVDNLPPNDTTDNKLYFADGSVSVYQVDANNDCRYTADGSGDMVYIFMSMRRGGRFVYALDVTKPDDPKLLWKRSEADFAELGYSWSIPAVAIANLNGAKTPVLVFAGGYDPDVEDVRPTEISAFHGATPQTLVHSSGATQARTMGRRIFVVNASDGALLWSAGGTYSSPVSGVPQATIPGMDYAMPSDAVILDTNGDLADDRFYIGDTAGNVWRGDISDPDPSNWQITQLASIDSSTTARRKFLYAPVVVAGQEQDGTPFHAVLVGSGDREHPFDESVTNRFYMFKDPYTGLYSNQSSPITEAELFDATYAAPAGPNKGWYITLRTGEKVVSNAAVLNGVAFFNTNTPPGPPAPGLCATGLGTARLYAVDYLSGGGIAYVKNDNPYDPESRSTEYPGGGFPPPPTPAVVDLDGEQHELVISGTNVTEVPGAALGARIRTYWYSELD